jgi:hypothetical protein
MAFNPNIITLINLTACIIILILGNIIFTRNGSKGCLLIGISFGLFGLSHLLTLLGIQEVLGGALILIRTLAYLLVILAMALLMAKRP